jgi:selenocysteine lyase/cysteine desulfurase
MNIEGHIDELRAQFPVTDQYIYLNHAAVAPLPQSVIYAVNRVTQEKGDSGGLHWMDWEEEAEETRKAIAKLINAMPEEISFVPNTSEGLSIIANGLKWKNDNIVTNDLEFPSVVFPWQIQAKKHGLELRIVRNRNEALLMEDFEDKIDKNTRIVAVSHVQFSNGFKIDLERLSGIAHENNAYVIVDGVQAIGQTPVDVKKRQDIDFLATSGYKWLLSPVATGFLFLKRELLEEIDPTFVGYRSDELEHEFHFREISPMKNARRFEHGQLNFPGIAGMRVAISLIEKIGVHNIENRIRTLMDYLIAGISELKGLEVVSSLKPEHRSGIIKVSIMNPHIDPEEIVTKLHEENIIISSRAGGLRISCNFYNTNTEIDQLLDKLSLLTQKLQ